MIHIDGSQGEGGGQILRTSLGLSLVTGTPFTIENIRAGRKKPGLMRQHLTAVNAAVEVGVAEVTGAALNSQTLTFRPTTIRGGTYRFAVGTAGSCTLVLQTVLPALLLADEPSDLVLEGGTHNPFAPPFDFLQQAFLPLLRRMGANVTATLEAPGFYPAGGGRFTVQIEPVKALKPLELLERGNIVARRAVARAAQIPRSVGEREVQVLSEKLGWEQGALAVEVVEHSRGPGNILVAQIESEQVTEVFTGFGEKGVKAKHVARDVVNEVRAYLAAGVPVGPHLADQLLIPLALAGGGRFRTLPLTRHTETNIEMVQKFLEVGINVNRIDDNNCEVVIGDRKA